MINIRFSNLYFYDTIYSQISQGKYGDDILENTLQSDADFFGTENIWKILLKIAPTVMAAQLIQSLYNIIDSFFVGKYSGDALTALSIIYPAQQLITAIAAGTGVGVNTLMAQKYAQKTTTAAKTISGAERYSHARFSYPRCLCLSAWQHLSLSPTSL